MGFDKSPAAKSFLIEVSKGNIPGHSIVGVVARNPSVGNDYVDLWNANVPHIRATENQTWLLSSDNAEDKIDGLGARTVLIEYLNQSYLTQFATVEMDGLNDVVIANDCFRPQSMRVLTSGSSGYNLGNITSRSQTSNNIQGQIPYLTGDRGLCVDQDGHYTIPAGIFGFGIDVIVFYPKNEDGFARSVITIENGTAYTGTLLPFYQNGLQIDLNAPFSLPEKSDVDFQANSSNEDVPVTLTATLLLVEEEYLNAAVLSSLGVF